MVERAYEHALAWTGSSCVMLTGWPATVMVVLRVVPVFCDAAIDALPDPVPLPATSTHEVPELELHAHPACVVTFTVVDPPDASNDNAEGVTL